jgi:hypothetical protein
MCLEDLQIAMHTSPFVRTGTVSATAANFLPANPRRWGLVLPSPFGTLIGWSLGILPTVAGANTQFITGQAPGSSAGGDVSFPGVCLTIANIGMAITMDLNAVLFTGLTANQAVIEILFNEDVPPFMLKR